MSRAIPNHLSSKQQTALIVLRILIGWHFLYEGYYKLMLPGWSSAGVPLQPWTSAGYLKAASGPLAQMFQWMIDKGWIHLIKSFGKREEVEIPEVKEGHGGGDDRLRDLIFRKTNLPDYMQLPDSRAGAMSCLTGIAARTSVEQKRPVKLTELIRL